MVAFILWAITAKQLSIIGSSAYRSVAIMTSIDTDLLDDLTAFMGQLKQEQTQEYKQHEEHKAGLARALAAARASEADLVTRNKRHRSEDEKRKHATAPRTTSSTSSSGTHSGSALSSSSTGSLLSIEWDAQIRQMNDAVVIFRRQLHDHPLQPLPIDQLRTRLLAPGVPIVFKGLPTTATLREQQQQHNNNNTNAIGLSPISPHHNHHLFVRHQSGDEEDDEMSSWSIPDSKLPATPDQGQRPINNKPPSNAIFVNGVWTQKVGVPDSPDIFAAAGLNDEPATRFGGHVKRMTPSKKNSRVTIPEKMVKWSETNGNVADLTDLDIDEEKLAKRGLTRDLREYDPRVPAGVAFVNGQWVQPGVITNEIDPFPDLMDSTNGSSSSPSPSLPPTPTRASLLSISLPRFGMSTLAECDEDAITGVNLDDRAIKRLPQTPNNKQIIGGSVPANAVYVDGEWRSKNASDEPHSPSWPAMDDSDLKPIARDRIPIITPSRQVRKGQVTSEEWPLELPSATVAQLPAPQKHMLINGNPPAGAHFVDGEWISDNGNDASQHVHWPDDGRSGKVNFRPIHDRGQPDLPIAHLDEAIIAAHVEHMRPPSQSQTASMVNGEWTDASSSAEDVEWPDDDEPSAPEAPIPVAKGAKVGIGAHGVNHQQHQQQHGGGGNINDDSMDDIDVDDQHVGKIVERLPVKNNNDLVNPSAPSNASFVNGQWVSNTGAEPEPEWPEDVVLKPKSPATPMRPIRNDAFSPLNKTPVTTNNNNNKPQQQPQAHDRQQHAPHDDNDAELELDDGGLDHLVATQPQDINHGEAGRGPPGTAFVNGQWIRITDEVDEPEWPDDVHDVDPLQAYAARDGRDHEMGIPEIGEDAFSNINMNRLKGVGLVAKDAQFVGGKWISTNAAHNTDDVEWPDIDSNDSMPRAVVPPPTNPTPPRGHHRTHSNTMTPSAARYPTESWDDVEVDPAAGKLQVGVPKAVSNRVPSGVKYIDGRWVSANAADDAEDDPFAGIDEPAASPAAAPSPAVATAPVPSPTNNTAGTAGAPSTHHHAPPPGAHTVHPRRSISMGQGGVTINPLARWQERDSSDGENSEAGELEDAIEKVAEHGIKLKPLAEHEIDDDGFPNIEHADEAQLELQRARQRAAAKQAAAIAAKKNGGNGLSLTTGPSSGNGSAAPGAGGKRHSLPAPSHLTIGGRSGISPQPSPRLGPGSMAKKSMTLPGGVVHTGSHAELDEFELTSDKEQEIYHSQRDHHRVMPSSAVVRAESLIVEPLTREWLVELAKQLAEVDAARPQAF